MNRNHFFVYSVASGISVALALFKLVYSFFPYFFILDVLIFGLVGVIAGYFQPGRRFALAATASLATVLLCIAIVARVGADQLAAGVGTWWLISLVMVPTAAVVGAAIGGRLRSSSATVHS